ncbi:MAG: bifunctional metallophosphatase/5'-nucleotidase [Bacteroidales bacterium]
MRRYFLLSIVAIATFALSAQNEGKLAIIHTNDTHSQIEPFGENAGERSGMAGLARRATLVKELREEYSNLLLLDAGDFFQGTPYFNFFNGELEVRAMNLLGYDAVTLGNHEFDNGVEFLANALRDAKFDVVCSNYDFTNTPLQRIIKPYVIKEVAGQRVGIVAMSINPKGLIAPNNMNGITYNDPYESVIKLAKRLRDDQGCSMIICLSHIGHNYEGSPSDLDFAKLSSSIDLVVGGHSHTYLEKALELTNAEGEPIVVTQAGSKGQYVGKLIYDIK